MSTMSITISNSTVSVKNQAFRLDDAADKRSVLTFTVVDSAGTASYVRGQPVVVTDSVLGTLYSGYVSKSQPTKLSPDPTVPNLEHAITCMDKHYLADKRVNVVNYINWNGGDIICDFINRVLSTEGVTGAFAQRADYTQASFAQGTLSGTVATNNAVPLVTAPQSVTMPSTANTGDLELVTAGSTVTITEQTTSDFGSGTLTNMMASSNILTPTTQSAVCVQAQLPTSLGVLGASTSVEIWSGSVVVGANDTLNYDIWIASTSPAFAAAVDLGFSDATTLSGVAGGVYDQNGLLPGPTSPVITTPPLGTGPTAPGPVDLTNFAKDTWYTRTVGLASLSGKTINTVSVAISGNGAGAYVVYVKNCYLGSASSAPFFATNAIQTQVNPPVVLTATGFQAALIVTTVVQAYNPATSSRVSPTHSIDAVKLVRSSIITWTAALPVTTPTGGTIPVLPTGSPTSSPAAPQSLLFVSYDATTWLPCTNQVALPGLPAGANVAGLSLSLQERFSSGPYPTALPSLIKVTITLQSAAAATTSDVTAAYGTTAQWNAGTEVGTLPNANGDLSVGGTISRNWNDNLITNQTFFQGINTPAATQSAATGAYVITSPVTGSGQSESRFDFASSAQDCTIECDLTATGTNTTVGFLYRTTGWSNYDNNFGYAISYNTQTGVLHLSYGSNTSAAAGAGSSTTITGSSVSAVAGTTYHVKLILTGARHQVFWNHSGSATMDVIDTHIAAAGEIGFYLNNGGAAATGTIDNFTVTPVLAGTWQSTSLSLSTLGTTGNAQIGWTEVLPSGALGTTAIVSTSLDGGTTWLQCQVNGGTIPQLPKGTNVSGKSLLVQIVLFAAANALAPQIWGLYVRVCGTYGTVTGTRLAPVLQLSPVGRIASSTVAWNANTPNGTSVSVAVAPNSFATYYVPRVFTSPALPGSPGTDVTSNNGGPVPGYYHQPSPVIDVFTSDSHISYVNTNIAGGSASTWTYDTPHSRITASGGTGGLFLFSGAWSLTSALTGPIQYQGNPIQYGVPSRSDVDLFVDMDESDAGGLVWRCVDASDYYELGCYDDSSSGGFTNQLRLYKVSGGVRSLLGSASTISWPRSTAGQTPYKRIRVTMTGAVINVYFDGTLMQTYTDLSPLGAGLCGLRNDGGTSRYYQFRLQLLGDSMSGVNLYTKVTLSTSDPAQMPQLFVLVASVRGPGIASGLAVPQLHNPNLPFAQYIAKEMDSLVQASGDYYWLIDTSGVTWFQQRLASPAPWILASSDPNVLYTPTVTPTSSADLYRNGQYVTGTLKLITVTNEPHVADGTATSWQMTYPLFSAPTVTSNGIAKSIGVQGIDTGKDLYWSPGSQSITQDTSATTAKIPAGTLMLYSYVGQQPSQVNVNNATEQTARALVETGTSGIIEEIEAAPTSFLSNMTVPTGTTWANGLLSRYGTNNTIEVVATTKRYGLLPGQITSVFISEFGYLNLQLPIVRVVTQAEQQSDGTVYYTYQATLSNGPNLSNWASVWF